MSTAPPVEATVTGAPDPVEWGAIAHKPATFPPSPHTHPVGDITGLEESYAAFWAPTDNGDGTFTLPAGIASDEGDGTFTIGAP